MAGDSFHDTPPLHQGGECHGDHAMGRQGRGDVSRRYGDGGRHDRGGRPVHADDERQVSLCLGLLDEGGQFIGAVVFARGANNAIGREFGLSQEQVCELVRVALREHAAPVSQIIAVALRLLRSHSDGLRLVVSFADSRQNHHGGIYQAGNWTYVGRGQGTVEFLHEGRWKHNREVTSGAFGGERKVSDYACLPRRRVIGKHKYLYPLDAAMRKQIDPLRQPYPKRTPERGAVANDGRQCEPDPSAPVSPARVT